MEKKSPYKPGGMFEGASPILFDYAKQLRKTMTTAEMLLWGHLKKGIEGYKFRRQHPLASYIADLYCHKLRLIIEVDGNIHDKPEVRERDLLRERELKELGYSIIRFTNKEILNNVQSVVEKIEIIIRDDLAKQLKIKSEPPFREVGGLKCKLLKDLVFFSLNSWARLRRSIH